MSEQKLQETPILASSSSGAIKKRKEDKIRKRDHRAWANVLKCCSNLPEAQKMSVICEKYNELYDDLRATNASLLSMEKHIFLLQKEKDHSSQEVTKYIMQKSKLEDLCRELQKQNKVIKEENINRVKEEEDRRREVSTSFTEKLNSLTSLMDENKDKSVRLREENATMTAKLTELYDQFQEREKHLESMNRQMELQKKLSDTQLKKFDIEFQKERQLWTQERQALLQNLEQCDETNNVLRQTVTSLEVHLNAYKSQHTEIETTMEKSNRVFQSFKDEMSKMHKAKDAAEKERNVLFNRCQSTTKSLVKVTEINDKMNKENHHYGKKISMLEQLCRKLQVDRTAYIQQLKDNDIEPITPSYEDPAIIAKGSVMKLKKNQKPKPETVEDAFFNIKPQTPELKELETLDGELKKMEDALKSTTEYLSCMCDTPPPPIKANRDRIGAEMRHQMKMKHGIKFRALNRESNRILAELQEISVSVREAGKFFSTTTKEHITRQIGSGNLVEGIHCKSEIMPTFIGCGKDNLTHQGLEATSQSIIKTNSEGTNPSNYNQGSSNNLDFPKD